jgi:hypothetical protein
VLVPVNPDSGGRTALRWLERPRDARSVSSRIPPAFSRGQATPVGLTSIGLRHHQHKRARASSGFSESKEVRWFVAPAAWTMSSSPAEECEVRPRHERLYRRFS